ncbi:BRCA1-associated protein, partial [Nymphaea thermarum]
DSEPTKRNSPDCVVKLPPAPAFRPSGGLQRALTMFALRIHSIDLPRDGGEGRNPRAEGRSSASQSFIGGCSPSTAAPAFPFSSGSPKIEETRGILHIFRNVSEPPASVRSLPVSVRSSRLPASSVLVEEGCGFLPLLMVFSFQAGRGTVICVLAVPNYMSYADFCDFCGSHVEHMVEMRVIRDDGMEDRYSILVTFDDQNNTDNFYRRFNGKKFPSAEAEVCHILFSVDVQYTDSTELAGTPPRGLTELPSCPACLERLDQDISGIPSTLCNHSFHCSCVSKWPNSSCVVCHFCQVENERSTCSVCETSENLWICVICGFVGCGRYKEGHAIRHWKDTHHSYSLDLENQRVWDYVGDSYVHRLIQSKSDGKLVELNSSCGAANDDWGDCACTEDSGISRALFISKVEAIVDEYNRLLASQLENQRQYYESLLAEAKEHREKTISEAVEKAVSLELQRIQLEYEKCLEDKKAVSDVRDIVVYIEAQKTLEKMPNSDDIKGGTVLAVQRHSSSAATKRSTKMNKRRS